MFHIHVPVNHILLEMFCFWLGGRCELWLATVTPNTHHNLVSIHVVCNFERTCISNITWKLWPPEVYQICSIQLIGGWTGCGCGISVGVSESGYGDAQNVCFLFSVLPTCTQPHSHMHHFENMRSMIVSYGPKYTLHTLDNTPFCTYFKFKL